MVRAVRKTPTTSNIADREYDLENEMPWVRNESVAQVIDEEDASLDSIEAALYIRNIENRIQIVDKNIRGFQDTNKKKEVLQADIDREILEGEEDMAKRYGIILFDESIAKKQIENLRREEEQ